MEVLKEEKGGEGGEQREKRPLNELTVWVCTQIPQNVCAKTIAAFCRSESEGMKGWNDKSFRSLVSFVCPLSCSRLLARAIKLTEVQRSGASFVASALETLGDCACIPENCTSGSEGVY